MISLEQTLKHYGFKDEIHSDRIIELTRRINSGNRILENIEILGGSQDIYEFIDKRFLTELDRTHESLELHIRRLIMLRTSIESQLAL